MLPAESAHDTVAALGEVGLLQFKDLNPDKSAFQRTFANQVRPVVCAGQQIACCYFWGLYIRHTSAPVR